MKQNRKMRIHEYSMERPVSASYTHASVCLLHPKQTKYTGTLKNLHHTGFCFLEEFLCLYAFLLTQENNCIEDLRKYETR